ncbi:uncharacterized protein LOC133792482 [Humulus lupulus]|uniref:uncharacterized protein LOC133792482 n=1 Tax=Humulus lupulus TaxID=3486 RepID=UPI002B417370|nr:uncharacterized protein LOC133792482 [Humulus lupulus]
MDSLRDMALRNLNTLQDRLQIKLLHLPPHHLCRAIKQPYRAFLLCSASSSNDLLSPIPIPPQQYLQFLETTQSKVIGTAKRSDHLFLLQQEKSHVPSCSFSSKDTCIDVHTWHKRLGYPSMKVTNSFYKILDFPISLSHTPCHICHLAKQKKLPFDSNNNMDPLAFDLIHMDIRGPYSIPTLEGYKYFVTIVDYHT